MPVIHTTRAQGLPTLLALGVAAALALALVACSSGGTQRAEAPDDIDVEPVRGGHLVVATPSEVDGFNPLSSQWSGPGFQIARAVLDPMAVIDAEGNWQPYLMQAFIPDETFRNWIIELRPDVTFHNGEVLDADALIVYLDAVAANVLTSVALPETPTLTKLDDLRVQVGFTEPWSSMPVIFADQPGYVIAPEQVRSGDTTHPIGTGPFVYQEWIPDKHFRASRNANYWRDDLPHADSIEFRPMPDRDTRFNALRTGEVNIAEAGAIGNERLDPLRAEGMRVVERVGISAVLMVLMNMEAKPTSEHRVREAIARGLDREAFRAVLFDESFDLATQPYADDNVWYRDNGYPSFDPDAARALVDEYEAEHGPLELTITAIGAGDSLKPVEYLQQALAPIGIDVRINGMETVAFVQKFVSGDYQAVYIGGFFGSPDPDGLYHFLVGSNAAPETPIKLNFARHRSEVIDAALRAQRTTDDDEARAAEWAKIWRTMAEDLPYAFLMHDRLAYVTAPDVHGFENSTTPEGVALPAVGRWSPFFTDTFIAP